MLEEYKRILNVDKMPDFLEKYLNLDIFSRLKYVGYFCGMDYASKDVYDFKEYISRYDHSLTVALIIWKFTKDKASTLAGLFHDIATPCFSHVIDYMNGDYLEQESTEEYTSIILKSDKMLEKYLKEDNIDINEIINFKDNSIVDLKRPKLCADRIDGIILTSLFWIKNLNIDEVKTIIDNIVITKNEDGEYELAFKNKKIAKRVIEVNKEIDLFCHSKEDNYMMNLLADITKDAIKLGIFKYGDLYTLNEKEIIKLIEESKNAELKTKWEKFKTIKKCDILKIALPPIKERKIAPLVENIRIYL